jgi:chromosome partitioning protein
MLPVFNMIDRRRKQPLAALAVHPDWPVVPSASGLDAMATIPPLSGMSPHNIEAARVIATL